jgi:hypothetical protein
MTDEAPAQRAIHDAVYHLDVTGSELDAAINELGKRGTTLPRSMLSDPDALAAFYSKLVAAKRNGPRRTAT